MRKINKLPDTVIAKIAAGEVIERPAYAVKELIENAIDANANSIEVHIQEAGLKRIQIIDNGWGMSWQDLEISFLPHTTSKLQDEHELVGIKTLGFRGEALSSIAAISNLTIQSRQKNAVGGTMVKLRNGKVESIRSVGMPVGTVVTIDQLFHSVPARKKFLKSQRTEFRLVTEIVTHFALSFTNIHFLLTHNKKTILDLPSREESVERIKRLLGSNFFEQLLPLNFEDGYIKISGFVGKPQIASKYNQKQFLFINNRFVTDKIISLAMKESFGALLPSANTPTFILHLNIPFEMVDVNVHPRKEQVVFVNAKTIFDAIKLAVSQTFTNYNVIFNLSKFKQETSTRIGETHSFSSLLLKQTVLPWNKKSIGNQITIAPVTQIHKNFILTVAENGIVIIDQHAAHERVLYEDFKKTFAKERKKRELIHLKKSVNLNVSVAESQILEEYKGLFKTLGFDIEHFGGNSYVIRSIPMIFKGRNIEKIIKDTILDLSENFEVKHIDLATQRMLAFLSCRSAVMAGDSLTDSQMKQILKDLEKTPNNATCPHGRPITIEITIEELNRSFKRR